MEKSSQLNHILINRRRHSSLLDISSFKAADCETDHYLVVTKVRERLALNEIRFHRFHMERFNLKKLNRLEGREKCCIEVPNRFAGLEDLAAEVDINST
jgi:hypothetical protein